MDVSADPRHNATTNGEGELSPVEQEVLDEYAKLVGNLDNVRSHCPFHSLQVLITNSKYSFPAFSPNSPQTHQRRSSMR